MQCKTIASKLGGGGGGGGDIEAYKQVDVFFIHSYLNPSKKISTRIHRDYVAYNRD